MSLLFRILYRGFFGAFLKREREGGGGKRCDYKSNQYHNAGRRQIAIEAQAVGCRSQIIPGCFEELLDEEEEEEEVDFFEEEEGLVFRLEAPFPFDLKSVARCQDTAQVHVVKDQYAVPYAITIKNGVWKDTKDYSIHSVDY